MKKNFHFLIPALFAGLALCFSFSSCGKDDDEDTKVDVKLEAIEFTSSSQEANVGDEFQLKLIATPSKAKIGEVTYSSDNKEVAEVDEKGNVTCKAEGTAKIKAMVDDLVAKCIVTVTEPTPEGPIYLKGFDLGSKQVIYVPVGEKVDLSWSLVPAKANSGTYAISINTTDYVKIGGIENYAVGADYDAHKVVLDESSQTSGTITLIGSAVGSSTLTVYAYESGKWASSYASVRIETYDADVKISSATVTCSPKYENITLKVGEEYTPAVPTFTIEPDIFEGYTVKWFRYNTTMTGINISSSSTAIDVREEDGTITAKAASDASKSEYVFPRLYDANGNYKDCTNLGFKVTVE